MTNFPLKSKILELFNGKWGSEKLSLQICVRSRVRGLLYGPENVYSQFSSKNFHEELWKKIGYAFYVIESKYYDLIPPQARIKFLQIANPGFL